MCSRRSLVVWAAQRWRRGGRLGSQKRSQRRAEACPRPEAQPTPTLPLPEATGRMDGRGSPSLTARWAVRGHGWAERLNQRRWRCGGWGRARGRPRAPSFRTSRQPHRGLRGRGSDRRAGRCPTRRARAERGAAGAQGLAGRGKTGTLGVAGRDSRGRRPVARAGAKAPPAQAPARRETVASSAGFDRARRSRRPEPRVSSRDPRGKGPDKGG